jgi:hypothetical protein
VTHLDGKERPLTSARSVDDLDRGVVIRSNSGELLKLASWLVEEHDRVELFLEHPYSVVKAQFGQVRRRARHPLGPELALLGVVLGEVCMGLRVDSEAIILDGGRYLSSHWVLHNMHGLGKHTVVGI